MQDAMASMTLDGGKEGALCILDYIPQVNSRLFAEHSGSMYGDVLDIQYVIDAAAIFRSGIVEVCLFLIVCKGDGCICNVSARALVSITLGVSVSKHWC
jgi:hypothetical protein